MILDWSCFLIVCPLCFVAGCIDAIAGGGGLISLPAYYLAGLPPHLAAGTNKLSASIGTTVAACRYFRSGKIAWKPALLAALGALPGAYAGAELLKRLNDGMILQMMVLLLPIIAVLVLFRRSKPASVCRLSSRQQHGVCVVIGLTIGFYDGLIGPGTGTFLIMLFTLILGMEAITASGSAKVVNLASNTASLIAFLRAGQVLWTLGLAAAVFSMLGSMLGASVAIRRGEKLIRWGMLFVLSLLLCNMVRNLLLSL